MGSPPPPPPPPPPSSSELSKNASSLHRIASPSHTPSLTRLLSQITIPPSHPPITRARPTNPTRQVAAGVPFPRRVHRLSQHVGWRGSFPRQQQQ
jgi:hypothetical protein